MNDCAYHFFEDLGCKVSEVSGESRDGRSFSSGCQSQSSVLTRPCSTSHSFGTTIRTSSHSTYAFNLYYQGHKNNNNPVYNAPSASFT